MELRMVLDPKNNWIQVELSFDKKEEEVEKSIIALPDDYKPAQKPYKAVSVAVDPEGRVPIWRCDCSPNSYYPRNQNS
jgi:hypothetical protein